MFEKPPKSWTHSRESETRRRCSRTPVSGCGSHRLGQCQLLHPCPSALPPNSLSTTKQSCLAPGQAEPGVIPMCSWASELQPWSQFSSAFRKVAPTLSKITSSWSRPLGCTRGQGHSACSSSPPCGDGSLGFPPVEVGMLLPAFSPFIPLTSTYYVPRNQTTGCFQCCEGKRTRGLIWSGGRQAATIQVRSVGNTTLGRENPGG